MRQDELEAGRSMTRQGGNLWLATFTLLCGLIIGWLVHDRQRKVPVDPTQSGPVAAEMPAPRQKVPERSLPVLPAPIEMAQVAKPLESPPLETHPPVTEPPVATITEPAIVPAVASSVRDDKPAISTGSLAATTPSGGSVTGHIFLEGTPPPEILINMDPSSRALQTNTPTTRFFVVSTNGGLGDVVVFLAGRSLPRSSANELPPLVIDHRRCFKLPYISAAVVGQPIILTNSDPLMHACHVVPGPQSRNRGRNVALNPRQSRRISFWSPEEFIRLKCDVHPWEFAYVSVFPNRFFAVTDEQGSFTIKDVPAGHYQLQARHRMAVIDAPIEVEVREGNVTQAELRMVVAN